MTDLRELEKRLEEATGCVLWPGKTDDKGRGRVSLETCGRARLSPDNVRLIYSSSQPAALIAKKFGVSESAVRHIRAGRSWRHESAAIRASREG